MLQKPKKKGDLTIAWLLQKLKRFYILKPSFLISAINYTNISWYFRERVMKYTANQFLVTPRGLLRSCVTRSKLHEACAEVLPHPNPEPINHIASPPLFIKTLRSGRMFKVIQSEKKLRAALGLSLITNKTRPFWLLANVIIHGTYRFKFTDYNVTYHMSLQWT